MNDVYAHNKSRLTKDEWPLYIYGSGLAPSRDVGRPSQLMDNPREREKQKHILWALWWTAYSSRRTFLIFWAKELTRLYILQV